MYRYVYVGQAKNKSSLPPPCPEFPCQPAMPGKGPDGTWTEGYKVIKGGKGWTPVAISAIEFSSLELAQMWLKKTAAGKQFKASFDYIVLVCVDPGKG
jgi:hypothetical protein